MGKGLKIAPPPQRPAEKNENPEITTTGSGSGFSQIRPDQMVQFNKRIPKSVADTFEILAIKTNMKVPQLLSEAIGLLQAKYGKV